MVGKWLAFAPDNEAGGFYMGMAACEASGANKNMPIVFMRGPADEPQVSLITLSHPLRKPPTRMHHALRLSLSLSQHAPLTR